MKTITVGICVMLLASVACGDQAWWDKSFAARREVTVYVPLVHLPGDDAAVISFYTGGHLKADGSDIRVVTDGKVVPHRLYGIGPGDKVTLAFKVRRDRRTYYVYFGNRQTAAPTDDWEPQRGLVLETRHYNGGSPSSLPRMLAIYKKSSPFYGAGEVERIWQGHNLFGPSVNFVSRYLGWLICPVAGTYYFVTSSDDASFLLVDGKLVVAWPGWHGPVADTRHRGHVALTRGMHRLEYLHVNGGGGSCAVAAWRPPRAKKFDVIPRTAFAPLSRTVVGPLELAEGQVAPDFHFEIVGEALMTTQEPIYAVNIVFRNRTKGRSNQIAHWDFGDGLETRGTYARHIYLADGIYPVTMSLGSGDNGPSVTERIEVHQHWGWQTKKQIDDIAAYIAEISHYDTQKLDLAGCVNLLKLARDRGSLSLVKQVALVIISRHREASRDDMKTALETLRDTFGIVRMTKDSEILKAYSETFKSAESDKKALLALELTDILLELGRPKEAAAFLTAALAGDIPGETRRRLFIAYGDTARYSGDASAARTALEAADAIKIKRTNVQEIAMTGALALNVEDYIAKKQYNEAKKALDKWTWEDPLEKLVGYSAYMTGRLYLAQGRRARALAEFGAIVAVSPESPWAPAALLAEAQIYKAAGETAAADQRLEKISSQYKMSPEAKQAQKLLKGNGR